MSGIVPEQPRAAAGNGAPEQAEAVARTVALARRGDAHVEVAPDGSALELCVTAALHAEPRQALSALFESLRERSARENVRALGIDHGFRLEDAAAMVLGVPGDLEAGPLQAWLARRLSPGTAVATVATPGPLVLAAALRSRLGFAPERTRYARDAQGRVRVEAFELHAAEHCNLRCANCCNMSPLVGKRFLRVAEVRSICAALAPALHADVVKIMGGEPLLHPDVAGVIHALRDSGIGDRVRLFTNGLLLHRMPEAFWEALDELTISDYRSAPVPRATLEMTRARSLRHDFVLNIKPVGEFSQVLSPAFQGDDARVADTYRRCWLRHRCLVVRRGRFYMCTRAAYADDFLATVEHQPLPPGVVLDRSGDGVPIALEADAARGDADTDTDTDTDADADAADSHGCSAAAALAIDAGGALRDRRGAQVDAPDLGARLVAYLDRTEPLGACSYCFGGDGAVEPHYQLTKADVAAGKLSRRLTVMP